MRRFISGFAILVCAWPAPAQSPDEAARFFEMRIRPLLVETKSSGRGGRWLSLDEAERAALPAPVRTLLARLRAEGR